VCIEVSANSQNMCQPYQKGYVYGEIHATHDMYDKEDNINDMKTLNLVYNVAKYPITNVMIKTLCAPTLSIAVVSGPIIGVAAYSTCYLGSLVTFYSFMPEIEVPTLNENQEMTLYKTKVLKDLINDKCNNLRVPSHHFFYTVEQTVNEGRDLKSVVIEQLITIDSSVDVTKLIFTAVIHTNNLNIKKGVHHFNDQEVQFLFENKNKRFYKVHTSNLNWIS
jgi:hypothetical protein